MARHAPNPRNGLSRARPPPAGRSRLWRRRLWGTHHARERPRRHAGDRGTGRAAQPQPEWNLKIDRPARKSRPGPAHHEPGRRTQPACRPDARRPRPPARRTGHTPRRRPRAALRPLASSRPQTPRTAVGEGHARVLSQAPPGPHRPTRTNGSMRADRPGAPATAAELSEASTGGLASVGPQHL